MKQKTIDRLRKFVAGDDTFYMRSREAIDVLALIAEVERLRAELAAERERAALICEGLRIYAIPGLPSDTLLMSAAARIRACPISENRSSYEGPGDGQPGARA